MVLLEGVEKEVYNALLYLKEPLRRYVQEETEGQIQAMC